MGGFMQNSIVPAVGRVGTRPNSLTRGSGPTEAYVWDNLRTGGQDVVTHEP